MGRPMRSFAGSRNDDSLGRAIQGCVCIMQIVHEGTSGPSRPFCRKKSRGSRLMLYFAGGYSRSKGPTRLKSKGLSRANIISHLIIFVTSHQPLNNNN